MQRRPWLALPVLLAFFVVCSDSRNVDNDENRKPIDNSVAETRLVLLVGVDGSLRAKNAISGEPLWTLSTGRPVVSSHSEVFRKYSKRNADGIDPKRIQETFASSFSKGSGGAHLWQRRNFTRPTSTTSDEEHGEEHSVPDLAVIPSAWGSTGVSFSRNSNSDTSSSDVGDVPVYLVESNGGKLVDVHRLPMGMREMVASSPVRAGDLVLVGSKYTTILVIDTATGALRRTLDHSTGSSGIQNFAQQSDESDGTVHDQEFLRTCRDDVILVGKTEYLVRAFDTLSGHEVWNVSTCEFASLNSVAEASNSHGKLRAIVDPTEGILYLTDARTGQALWTDQPSASASTNVRVVSVLDTRTNENILSFGDPALLYLLRSKDVNLPQADRSRAIDFLKNLLPGSLNSGGRFHSLSEERASDASVVIDSFRLDSRRGLALFALELPRWLDENDELLHQTHRTVQRLNSALDSAPLQIAPGDMDDLYKDGECSSISCFVGVHNLSDSSFYGDSNLVLLSDRPYNQPDRDQTLVSWLTHEFILSVSIAVLLLGAGFRLRQKIMTDGGDSTIETVPFPAKTIISQQPKRLKRKNGRKRSEIASERAVVSSDVAPNETDVVQSFQSRDDGERADINDANDNSFDPATGILRVGRLAVYTEQVLGYGSSGNMVFEGKLDGQRKVAVKRMLSAFVEVAEREIITLQQCDEHPHVVTYYGCERDREFVYLALAHCPHSLETFLASKVGMGHFDLADELRRLSLQICHGLSHLHGLNIVHRDLKPQNVLIDHHGNVQLSDMGLAKALAGGSSFSRDLSVHADGSSSSGHRAGTTGWMAPELLVRDGSEDSRPTKRVDIFSLGCLLHWLLCDGQHPFGDSLDRERAIVKGKPKVLGLPDGLAKRDAIAHHLISRMVARDPNARPQLHAVIRHPFFWPDDIRLQFIRDASDRFEALPGNSSAVVELEADAVKVLRLHECFEVEASKNLDCSDNGTEEFDAVTGWMRVLHTQFVAELRSQKFRKYKTSSVRDLLRVVRNKAAHFRDMSEEVQELLGPVPSGFLRYFLDRFPLLLAHTYHVIQVHAANDENLAKYFNGQI